MAKPARPSLAGTLKMQPVEIPAQRVELEERRAPMTFMAPRDLYKRLKALAVEEETTAQALLEEAVRMLLEKRGV